MEREIGFVSAIADDAERTVVALRGCQVSVLDTNKEVMALRVPETVLGGTVAEGTPGVGGGLAGRRYRGGRDRNLRRRDRHGRTERECTRLPVWDVFRLSVASGSEPFVFYFIIHAITKMGEKRPTRRRLLGVLAAGIGAGASGCTGTGSTDERDSSTRSTAGRRSATSRSATGDSSVSATDGTDSADTVGGTDATANDQPTTASARRRADSDDGTTTTADAVSGTTSADDAAGRGAYTVGMYTDLYFDPIGLFVEPGTTVSFELESGVHSASAYHPDNQYALDQRIPSGAPSWNTGQFDEEGAFRNVTFETRGTHDYYCIPHKQLGMVGRIVVGEPGGPAIRSPNPDGELPDSERIVEEGKLPYERFRSEER
jgi:plastocyanin